MKADLSRNSDQPANSYRTVRLQQGRVLLDADWNEQQAILHRRIEQETVDTLGGSAGPIDGGGFLLTASGQNIEIGAGRYYVQGLLCSNPCAVAVTAQPFVPVATSPVLTAGKRLLDLAPVGASALTQIRSYSGSSAVMPADGIYIGYLESWLRHVTALEDSLIRETALGGPDTASRDQLLWQVKLLRAGDLGAAIDCGSAVPAWAALVAPATGRMAARSEEAKGAKDPCLLSPEAGYRRLENQLYRVEIHDDGSLSGKQLFKWSRDNGSIISRVSQPLAAAPANEFEVVSIGRDDLLAISAGCWLEFISDDHDLLGQPGPLVKVLKTAGNRVTLDLPSSTGSLDSARFASNPRVRRWDGWQELDPQPVAGPYANGWVTLEDGVQVKFHAGTFRTGDYWTIPARTATADVEWPQAGTKAAFIAPEGVLRHYARLAVLRCEAGVWTRLHDCRALFPALSALTNLHYVGGDGQEVAPNPLAPQPVALPSPLQVAVFNGQWSVAKAQIRYQASHGVLTGAAGTAVVQSLDSGKTLIVESRADGSAAVGWALDPAQPNQQCQAELLVNGQPVSGRFNQIRFSARLAIAAQVAYDPAKVADLKAQNINNVQDAIDALGLRRQGGGCCVTVGEGGEFSHLDVALTTLSKDHQDLCICLLPGDHELADSIDLGAEGLKLAIHGSGAASRLRLTGNEFNLFDLDALLLRDFVITSEGDEQAIRLEGCQQLTLEGMQLSGSTASGISLLQISGCRRLRISDSRILAYQAAGLDKGRELMTRVTLLAPVTSLFSRSALFTPKATAASAKALAGYSAAEGKQLVADVDRLVRATDLAVSRDEGEALRGLAEAVSRDRSSRAIEAALNHLQRVVVAAHEPGNALMLADAQADMLLCDSQILGRLSLYGEASKPVEDDDDLRKLLGDRFRSGRAGLRAGRGRLQLRNVQLRDLVVADSMVEALHALADSDGGTLSEPCLRLLVVDNCSLVGPQSLLVAIQLGFNHNDLRPADDVGTVYAEQGKYLGNFADNDFRLWTVGHTPERQANGGLNIVVS